MPAKSKTPLIRWTKQLNSLRALSLRQPWAWLVFFPYKFYLKGPIGVGLRNARAKIFNQTKDDGRSTLAARPIRHGGSNEANCIEMRAVVYTLYIDLY